MDERMDGWSDEYGDDDYDSEPLDEYGYDYNAYDDGHVRYTRVAFTLGSPRADRQHRTGTHHCHRRTQG